MLCNIFSSIQNLKNLIKKELDDILDDDFDVSMLGTVVVNTHTQENRRFCGSDNVPTIYALLILCVILMSVHPCA